MPTYEIVWPSYIYDRNSLEWMEVEQKKDYKQTSMIIYKPTCHDHLCTTVSKSLLKQMFTCLLICFWEGGSNHDIGCDLKILEDG